MTVFSPNIPQPTDNPSDSQDLILENFQTLERLYGTNGDHYSWTNTGPTESTKHAKVTTPGLPTTTAPGNALPTPTAGNCSYFGQTRNSQTYPYLARDGLAPTAPLTNVWPVVPIKAFASFRITGASAGTLLDSFNLTLTSVSLSVSTYTITFGITNAMRSATSYGVLLSLGNGTASANSIRYNVINASSFSVILVSGASTPLNFTVTVIES